MSSSRSYQFGYSPSSGSASATNFLPYIPYEFVLLAVPTNSTRISLNGLFGTTTTFSYSAKFADDSTRSFSSTSSKSYIQLYVNNHLVETWYSAAGGIQALNYSYESDSVITSVRLRFLARAPYVQGLNTVISSSTPYVITTHAYADGYLNVYGQNSGGFPTVGSGTVTSGSIPDLPYDPEGGVVPPITDPDPGETNPPVTPDYPDYSEDFAKLDTSIEALDTSVQGLQSTLDEQKQQLDDLATATTDQTEEVKKGFSGVLEAITNLPKTIMDGIVHLFVPTAEDLETLRDDYETLFANKLGFIAQTGTVISNLFDAILTAVETTIDDTSYRFHFPGVSFDMPNSDGSSTTFVLLEEQDVNIANNEYFTTIRPWLSVITIIICSFAILNTAIRLFEAIFISRSGSYFWQHGGESAMDFAMINDDYIDDEDAMFESEEALYEFDDGVDQDFIDDYNRQLRREYRRTKDMDIFIRASHAEGFQPSLWQLFNRSKNGDD